MRIATALALFLACVACLCASSHSAPATYPPAQTTGGIVVPYYGATYGPAGLSASDGKRIIEVLESIDRRLEAIEAKTGGPLPQKKADPLPVAKARCAACHTQSKAAAKGGDFILFTDDAATALKPLNAREKTRVKEAVQSGSMPPNGKLSAADKAAFDW